MKKNYETFTGRYRLSKTLCFELIPQGRTLEYMEKNKVLEEDEHRAESYQKMKDMINEFHKYFIEVALNDVRLYGLDEYYVLYTTDASERNEKWQKQFENIQNDLRKQVANSFKKHPLFKKMFGKELFKKILPEYFKEKEEQELLAEFNGFTTYFIGFQTVRKNIYTEEAIASSIGYRLIHENLPLFIQNMRMFEKIKKREVTKNLPVLMSNLGGFLSETCLENYFSLGKYSSVLTQKGITEYNLLIGGYAKENGEKVQGINEYINLYNQKAEKSKRLERMKPLKKQILSDTQSFSFTLNKFETDEEVVSAIVDYYKALIPVLGEAEGSMMHLLQQIRDYDLEKIYVSTDTIPALSQRIFGNWNHLSTAMEAWYDAHYARKKKVGTKTFEQEKEKFFKNEKCFSISFLNTCCEHTEETKFSHVERYFETYGDAERENFYLKVKNLADSIFSLLLDMPSSLVLKTCTKDVSLKDRKLTGWTDAVRGIKDLLDEVMEYQRFLKPLSLKDTGLEADAGFYDAFTPMYESVSAIVPLYNKVRNYLTKKPYSKEKIKLNFSNSVLLNGWSVSKEAENGGVLLRKDNLFYLGIINKSFKKIFLGEYPTDGETYEKMEYRLLPGANKMLPKVFLAAKEAVEKYQPSEEILRIYKNGTFKKGKNFSLHDCHMLIDYFKRCMELREEWRNFGFQFSDTETYEDISGFYREVEAQGYQLTFHKISASYIDELVSEGKLYLFQIYNKDFSPYSKGTPNLHTMYFKALFEPENMKNVVYKLNGEAEVFYRKKSIESRDMITHPANQPVANKNPLNPKKESLFSYTLYKDRRYMMDKFQLHVPITMNFQSKGGENINADVNRVLKENKETYVIGINRGERHLLYLTVVDAEGTIVEEYSLNEIVNEYNGVSHCVNYHDLLENKADDRYAARKNWESIKHIKELKEGYISQVLHKLTQLMVKYQAVVVMEDLNFGFLRGRQAIEKNVYQNFEKMLIDKLNYYVDKQVDKDIQGGLYHAYQLTNKFESFRKMGKQNGFLFFVPTYYISNIDPTTGFVNLLYPRYENIKASRDFIQKFDDIFYDEENGYFCFDVDYRKFTEKVVGSREKWRICSVGERVRSFRNPQKNMQWDLETVYPTKMLKDLFGRYEIDMEKELKYQILAQTKKEFYVGLMDAMKMMLQMRNYGKEADYLISPVKNKDCDFFDSRKAGKGQPSNIEANGAYNIARKGLWMLKKIQETEEEKLGRERWNLTNEEWLRFAQNV